jgi:hypothetical protein
VQQRAAESLDLLFLLLQRGEILLLDAQLPAAQRGSGSWTRR